MKDILEQYYNSINSPRGKQKQELLGEGKRTKELWRRINKKKNNHK